MTGEVKRSESCSVVSDSAAPWTVQSVGFSRPESWRGWPFPSPGDLPNPGMEPRLPTLQEGSSPAEPPGKTKNTGVGSLSLLQLIFPTQESNWGLLLCRRILYQLSYDPPSIILLYTLIECSVSTRLGYTCGAMQPSSVL